MNIVSVAGRKRIVGLLLEGASIRHASRMTGHNKMTVNRLVRCLASVAEWQFGPAITSAEHKTRMASLLSGAERTVKSGDALMRLRAHLDNGVELDALFQWLPTTPPARRAPYRSTLRAWRAQERA